MSEIPEGELSKEQVSQELEEAKSLAKQFSLEEVKSGEWFFRLFQRAMQTYDQKGNAEYFKRKYRGLSRDEIADRLITLAARNAAIAGGIAGVTITGEQVSIIGTAGMTLPIFLGTVGAEMIYLAQLQMRLVLNIANLYDIQLDPEDPEDVMTVFGYALGVTPTNVFGKFVEHSARHLTKNTIKGYINKSTLKALQDFARAIGFKLLQRSIIKYAVPGISAAIGASYNYASTKTIGKVARSHFKNMGISGKGGDELRNILAAQQTYDIVFPAAALHMAGVDGAPNEKEQELYKTILARLSYADTHTDVEWQRLMTDESLLLDSMSSIDDQTLRLSLMDMLVLMAIYDGDISQPEIDFLHTAAERMGFNVDMDALYKRVEEYRVEMTLSLVERTNNTVNWIAEFATEGVMETAKSIKNVTVNSMGWLKSSLSRRGAGENPEN